LTPWVLADGLGRCAPRRLLAQSLPGVLSVVDREEISKKIVLHNSRYSYHSQGADQIALFDAEI